MKKLKKCDTKAIKAAIRLLVKKTDSRLCLLAEESVRPGVFLLVGVNEKGKIEYQISNGMDMHRSTSYDVYSLDEAIKLFDKVCKEGF